MRTWVQSLASLSGLRIWYCHELSCRFGSDLVLLCLWWWHRPAAVAQIQSLAWEPQYALDVALIIIIIIVILITWVYASVMWLWMRKSFYLCSTPIPWTVKGHTSDYCDHLMIFGVHQITFHLFLRLFLRCDWHITSY